MVALVHIKSLMLKHEMPFYFFSLYPFLSSSNSSSSLSADVGSWREGGGRNLNVASGPPEMDSKAPEEAGQGRGTPSPTGDADLAGKPSTGEGREKRDKLPAPAPQHKLNGGQQPPGGEPSQFHSQFRGMMPPYVS